MTPRNPSAQLGATLQDLDGKANSEKGPIEGSRPDARPGSSPSSSKTLAVRLWRSYLGRYWPILSLSLIAMAIYAGSASLIPAGVEWINRALGGTSPGAGLSPRRVAVWGPAIVVGLGLVNASAQYLQSRLSAKAALSTLKDLQVDLVASLNRLDDAQVRAFGAGQIISRLTNDVMVLRETLTRATTAVRDLMTLVGLCTVMVFYDPVLFAVVLAVYPIIGWPLMYIGKFLRRKSADAQAQAGEIASLAGELVEGARTIRAFGLEGAFAERAGRQFERRRAVLDRMAQYRAANEPFVFFVGSVALAIVIAVVAWRINAGALNLEQFFSFIIALLLMSQPARGLSTLNAVAQEGFAAFERLLRVIDTEPEIVDGADARALTVEQGRIDISDLHFSYTDDRAALAALSLGIPAGKTVALVGESGGGKSTLFNLLLRFYRPVRGEITIDGVAIDKIALSSLREAISLVSQDVMLFDDTVAANIAFGKISASQEEIEAAASAASANEFILALPQGYQTPVGERGNSLSGGQRQRIALARAFLKDAPILLLDEATSALDAETEAQIQGAIDRLARGRTTIVIAHRLSTVKDADLIAVVDRGRVIETGTHTELMEAGGSYRSLVERQLG